MAQQPSNNFPIDPFTTSGTELATVLNDFQTAYLSSESGTSRPAYAVKGYQWSDITASTHKLKYYTGSGDLSLIEFDTVNNKAILNGGDTIADTSKAVVLKNSSIASEVPLPVNMVEGELVLNSADKKIFAKDANGDIIDFSEGGTLELKLRMAGVGFDHYGTIAPAGALICNGGIQLKVDFPELYAVIGDIYATTGGATAPTVDEFRVPPQQVNDLGLYNRGVGATNGVVGTYQEDAFKEHDHQINVDMYGRGAGSSDVVGRISPSGTGTGSDLSTKAGDIIETRPRSLTVLKCIWTGK